MNHPDTSSLHVITLNPALSPLLPAPSFSDDNGDTLPVSLTMTSSQPSNPVVGYNYEAPYIGTSDDGESWTNLPPTPMPMSLTVTVTNLVAGRKYNLYRYETTGYPLPAGPLKVPTNKFNANKVREMWSSRSDRTAMSAFCSSL